MVFGTGPKAGDVIIRHPDVPLISFTGSTVTAKKIREASSPMCKKLSLEVCYYVIVLSLHHNVYSLYFGEFTLTNQSSDLIIGS